MSYLVFARKWRPKNFDEIIGQEHIAGTLKNAISLNRVAHAYLFSGPRGIGKTSTARILAKALNCEQGPTTSPCNVCSSCREISAGSSLDVMEIDGASNRGIEQIRQLRENVKFSPAKGRFKIYIIDEVHQITTDGFNALLKTLEEPPAHVKFIFATTQAYKVLPTILSRCQRFDFKPLSGSSISGKLKKIIKKEKLDVAEDALLYIARSAAGSMRDAESILDQLSAFRQGKVKLETVTQMLGTVDLELIEQISQKIIAHDTEAALTLVEKVINEGKDLLQFLAALIEYFRHILVAKISAKGAGQLIDLPADFLQRIFDQAKDINLEEVFYIINVLVRAQGNLRRTLSARVAVELAVVRVSQRENLSSLEQILKRLDSLEQDPPGSNPARSHPTRSNPGHKHGSNPGHKHAEQEPQQEPLNNSAPEELSHSWPDFLQAIREEKMFLASSLEFARLAGLEDKVLTIAFPKKYNFYKENLERAENKKFIETKAKDAFGRGIAVNFILDKETPDDSKQKTSGPTAQESAAEPIIQSALKIFQGRIIRKS
jgi:DNA polymerase-3 subunit gamma/tau